MDAYGQAAIQIKRLRAIVRAQGDIIDWYEDETDRLNRGTDQIADELREAEEALARARK